LLSLRGAAANAEPAEWDAMLAALLRADYYGVEDVVALLVGRDDDSDSQDAALKRLLAAGGGQCDEPSAAATEQPQQGAATQARRLQEHELTTPLPPSPPRRPTTSPSPLPQQERPPLPPPVPTRGTAHGEPLPPVAVPIQRTNADAFADGAADAADHAIGLHGRLSAWRVWLLDRPPPWERDCDCCFRSCPEGHNCLMQSDGLYLACRGESVGGFVHRIWTEWCVGCPRRLAHVPASLLRLSVLFEHGTRAPLSSPFPRSPSSPAPLPTLSRWCAGRCCACVAL
jgi:hypothetical protein